MNMVTLLVSTLGIFLIVLPFVVIIFTVMPRAGLIDALWICGLYLVGNIFISTGIALLT